jgi:pyruvate,water dikinase
MKWFRSTDDNRDQNSEAALREVQSKFSHFLRLLDCDKKIHTIIADLEGKARGECDFDAAYLRTSLQQLRLRVGHMIEAMIAIGGAPYTPLRERYGKIRGGMELLLPRRQKLVEEPLVMTFNALGRQGSQSVGSKCLVLGQIRVRLELPVPNGFAITGWAYHQFLTHNRLRERINQRISEVDIDRLDQLEEASREIQAMVSQGEVPAELSDAITRAADRLLNKSATSTFSVRSSAIGEDAHYSFAGQYETYLNVKRDELVVRYRDVIASKYSPQAMYYYLSLPQAEPELPMSVGCVEMIDAKASGVVYTRDPVRPHDEVMLINAVFGLGELVVDGTLTPDSFRVSRQTGEVLNAEIAHKPVRLVLKAGGGTVQQEVGVEEREAPSISGDDISQLVEFALRIERLYHCPQDIEWAMNQTGEIFILQSRPLKVIDIEAGAKPDLEDLIPVLKGGSTVCPGAGGGPVYHVASAADLPGVPPGAVLVAAHSFPGIVTVMQKVSAIITETGGVASHMATIAREYQVPTLAGVPRALESLERGREVTVDATKGIVYHGLQEQLLALRRPERWSIDSLAAACTLGGLLEKISPLNLVHPGDDNFAIDSCETIHDLTRFCHQRSMEEMFYGGISVPDKERVSIRLLTEIPVNVNIIFIDQAMSDYAGKGGIDENEIGSEPMRHFWNGVRHEGWPAPPKSQSVHRFKILGTAMGGRYEERYSESSFAILSKEYMIFGIRMGYHFMTVEGMCTPDPHQNYIRMQYKEGGSTTERRERRIKLIQNVLSRIGFEHEGRGDFLDTRLGYRPSTRICEALFKLGQLTVLTKQLDMALTTDSVAEWYTRQISGKLGLSEK